MTRIPNFEDYFITDDWKCYSIRKRDCIGSEERSGHIKLSLREKDNKRNTHLHILIAEMFVPIPEEYKDVPREEMVVHHIDFDPANNDPVNLQWLTDEQHKSLHHKGKKFSEEAKKKMSDKAKMRTCEKHPNYGKHFSEEVRRKMSEAHSKKSVAQLSIGDGEVIKVYSSVSDAERQTGISRGNISNCCNGRSKSAGGYKWRYED
jgi:hypothetical protein